MLHRLADLTDFEWISESLWKPGERVDGGDGHTIRHLLPDQFESYYKILHPMYRDTSVSDTTRTWRNNDRIIDRNLERVSWRDVANKYSVPYHRQINSYAYTAAFGGKWPRYLVAADEGTLDRVLLSAVSDVLARYTSSTKWYCEYFLVATKELRSDELYVGTKFDLMSANEQTGCSAGPEYWWPEDRAWCVCTDYDLDFTIVGSSRKAAEDIANTSGIEGFEMDISDRIDYRSHASPQ